MNIYRNKIKNRRVWYDSNKRRMDKTQMVLGDQARSIKCILYAITKRLEDMHYSSFHGILRERGSLEWQEECRL